MPDNPYAGIARPVQRPQPRNILAEKVEAGTAQSQASAASSAASAAEKIAGIPYVAAEKRATIANTQADAALKAAKLADAEAKKAAAADAKSFEAGKLREDAQNTLRKIREIRALVSGSSTGLPGQMLSGLGGTDARNLRAKLGSLAADTMLGAMADLKKASATGSTGLGQIAVFEAKALRDKIDSLDQFVDEEQLLGSLAAIEHSFRRRYALANQDNPDDPEVARQYGIILPGAKPPGDKPPPPEGDLTGEMEEVRPPELKGLNTTVSNMLKSGKSAGEIRSFLDTVQPGLGERAGDLEWYEDYFRQNPDKPIEPRLDMERYFRPKEGVARFVGEVADSPVGAAVIGGTDVLTGGFLDEMSDDPELARSVMSAVQQENPGAYLTGQVLGGVGGSAGVTGLSGLAARYGIPRLGAAGLATLEGGIYGAGSADSDSFVDRGVGAAGGALLGRYGQKALGAATRGGANLVGGIKNKSAELLNKYGIPLTVGEMVGGGVQSAERRIGQVPFFGEAVNARQQEGLEGFNKAAFNETLADIGETTGDEIGTKGIQIAKQKLGAFYDGLLKDKSFTPDEDFVMNTSGLRDEIANLPDIGPVVSKEINKKVGDLFDPSRVLSGTDWQRGLRDLKEIGRKHKNADLGPALKDGIDGLVNEFSELAARQAPDIVEGLNRANSAYRKYSILKDAVRDPAHPEMGHGVFAPETLMKHSAANAERFGSRGVSAEGKHPFFDLSEAGIDVLTPARKRNTALPYLLPASVTGLAAYGSHHLQGERNKETGEVEGRDPALSLLIGGTLGAAAAAPYSKLAQKYLQKQLVGAKTAGQKKAGEAIRGFSKVVGGGATAPLVDLFINEDLPRTEKVPSTDFMPLPPARFPASAVTPDDEEEVYIRRGDHFVRAGS